MWLSVLLFVLGAVAIVLAYLLGVATVTTSARVETSSTEASKEVGKAVSGLVEISGMQSVHLEAVQTLIQKFANDANSRITQISASDSPNPLLPNIIYINMAKNPDRNINTQAEVLKIPGAPNVYRFEGIPVEGNGAKGCYLSHLHVLSWAAQKLPGQHVVVLEDDFVLDVSSDELLSYLQEANTVCRGRWDVMILGQYVHKWQPLSDRIFRALHSTTTSGYLVNADYVEELFCKWHQQFVPIESKPRFAPEDNLDQIQVAFQGVDVWLAFRQSLGSQRPGVSTIGGGGANNKWTCSDDLKTWYDSHSSYPLETLPALALKKVGVCLVATGKYHQFLERVAKSCYSRFVKPHQLEFFVFTDAISSVPEEYSGCAVHRYFVERKGFPGDTLYRYHYMLKAEADLVRMDHIFYMDVDYWVCNPAETDKLLVEGLVAVKHLHNLHPQPGRIKGSPELNPASTACIPADKSMQFYFCGGFQGGSSGAYIQAMKDISAAIDTDDRNGVMAVWHDESHWNRYLVDHPPQTILSQSYVYDEACLDPKNQGDTAIQLRKQQIVPRMVALSKDASKFHVAA